MFKKVIVAEDIDSLNIGVEGTLRELSIDIQPVKYCDDALLRIKKAIAENAPFDLLITDLSFKEDHREVKISSGEELAAAVRQLQPDIKIIVLSVEDRPFRIKSLFEDFGIDAFIIKGRNSMSELKKAITHMVATGEQFIPLDIAHILADNSLSEIEKYDIELLKLLAEGVSQEEISRRFAAAGITPAGTSSIEKRISRLKIHFKAINNVNLIAIAKDLGLV